ncbi:TPA: hypothetical protein ACSP88_002532 [Aeromonas hydrophila]
MRLVGMRESKAVRRAVLAELNRLYAKAEETPKTTKELLVMALADIEAKEATIGKLTGQMATVTDLAREYSIRTGEKLLAPASTASALDALGGL